MSLEDVYERLGKIVDANERHEEAIRNQSSNLGGSS